MSETPSNGRNARRRQRGYNTNHLSADVQKQLKGFEATSTPASIRDAVIYYLWIIAIAAATYSIWQINAALGALAYTVALIAIARQQRGLELMIHDASHWAWDRINQSFNDFVANLAVAFPSMSTVANYRKSHFVHHRIYGGESDPCRRRFAAMGLGDIDLSTRWAIVKAVVRWLVPYNIEYYKEVGSKSWRTLGAWALWHGVVLIAPATALLGFTTALAFWVLFWLMPMLLTLPILRSIAESEEHDYGRGQTEFDSTFTNNGLMHQILWHPWNDAYHQIHHMFPSISARVHHKVHRLLMEHDPIYRASLFRTHTLAQPAK